MDLPFFTVSNQLAKINQEGLAFREYKGGR
jgi:hypothetical protein